MVGLLMIVLFVHDGDIYLGFDRDTSDPPSVVIYCDAGIDKAGMEFEERVDGMTIFPVELVYSWF